MKSRFRTATVPNALGLGLTSLLAVLIVALLTLAPLIQTITVHAQAPSPTDKIAINAAAIAADTGLDFDGVDDYVTFGAASELGVSVFTLETWFKREGAGSTANTGSGGVSAIPLIAKGRGEADGDSRDMNFFLGIHGTNNVLAVDFEDMASGGNHPTFGVTQIIDNVWYHAAATYDGTTWRLYLNGQLEIETTANATPRSDSIQHAGIATAMNSSGTASGYFEGLMDEVRIWNIARTQAEIQSTINAELTNGTGLVARWGMEEGSGTTIADSIAPAADGALTNGPTWIAGAPFDFVPTTTVAFQDGVGSYTGTRDTYTFDDAPDTVRGSENTFVQDINSGDERRSLLLFDLSSIPTDATITSAELQFHVDTEGQGFSMHRMLTSWDEATVTYNSIGGRHFAADDSDAESSVNANWPGVNDYVGTIAVAVPASTIQNWIDGTLANNGWLMIATHGSDGQQLRSREHGTIADRPKLTVVYSSDNEAPDQPVLVSPSDTAIDVSTSPALGVTVSDPNADDSTVTFWGRSVSNVVGDDFNLVALPDTQHYTDNPSNYANYSAQTQWIVENKDTLNIKFVTHLGDIVENGNNGGDDTEWQVADAAMGLLEDPVTTLLTDGIAYGLAPGNHDQGDTGNGNTGETTLFNQFFGVSRFTGRGYYGGNYGSFNDNNYELFTAGGMDFIIVHFEYDTTPEAAVLTWADNLLQTYSNRRAIAVTHYMLGSGNPGSFSTQGQAIYNALKDNPNLFLLLGGHVSGEGRRVDTLNGNTVHSLLADFQSRSNGGDGWLRVMEFSPTNNEIRVKTYSPVLDQYETDDNSQFTLSYDMEGSGSFTEISTNSGVSSGSSTSVPWPDLASNTEYEWYVTVNDGSTTTTGPVWSFTTIDTALAVSVGYFLAERDGDSVNFIWQTATETGNAGFNLLAETDGGLIQLNEMLIASTVIDSVEPTGYSYETATPATIFYIENVSITGKRDRLGPFALGVPAGVHAGTDGETSPTIWLPMVSN